MKKTHDANIGGTIFHVEDDAYGLLADYLASIAAHFASYEDSGDIVSDIEGRIAEQLAQGNAPARIVTVADVERVVAAMGQVEQFAERGGEAAPAEPAQGLHAGDRRLFRDTGHGLVAGVAAGLAAYAGLRPVLIRILFVAPFLFRPTRDLGLLAGVAYLLLWVLVPVAKTATDKLRMRGNPVTLATVEAGVRDHVIAIAPGTRNIVATSLAFVGSCIRMIVVGMAWVAGTAVVGAAAFGMLGATVLLVMMLVNPHVLARSGWMMEFMARLDGLYAPFVLCSYLVVVIPLAFIAMGAVMLLRKRRQVPARSAIALAGLWLVSLLVWVGMWATYYPTFR